MCKLFHRGLTYVLFLGALSALALPAQAQLSNSLTPEQVACNEQQLEQILSLMTLERGNDNNPNRSLTLLVTYSNEFGFYEGLAVLNQTPLRANAPVGANGSEHFLAFHLNPDIRMLLANPQRPQLAQVSLVREETASNLVAANSANALRLTLNPTLDPNAEDALLEINNFRATGQACGGARGVDVKPGRGLLAAGLTQACHQQLTDFDRHVFALLERMVRVQVAGSQTVDTKIAIFRGDDPLTYRIDVYPLSATGQMSGKIALELELQADSQGRITTGQLRILPSCVGGFEGGCTSSSVALEVFLLAPVFGGFESRLASGPGVSISFPAGASAPVSVDFGDLLSGTTWNQ
jgi:hypothetical protein